jgi:hypothetical protein
MSIPEPVKTVGYSHIYHVDKALVYRAGMQIDADGSPNAYHMIPGKGLDHLANAGKPGNWWGLACNDGGKPFVQLKDDPSPGFFVSTTALQNPRKKDKNPDRYVNSEVQPFIVLPSRLGLGVRLGDICFCYNRATGDNNYGIYADIGPRGQIGEGSIAMADTLKVPSNPRDGGCVSGIVYWLMPGSSKGFLSQDDWFGFAHETFKKWGGLTRLTEFANQCRGL